MTELQIARNIIQLLSRRKGFEYWWHDIDEDIKREIIAAIAKEIEQGEAHKDL